MIRIFNKDINLSCDLCKNTQYQKDKLGNVVFNNGINGRCPECYFKNKFLDANIGYDYWSITPNTWEGDESDLLKITKYFDKIDMLYTQGTGFYIYGEYGVGKTSLGCMLIKHILTTTNYSGLFVPFSELVILNSKIMTGWHDAEIEASINQIKNVDFLVLDDLAKEYDNERDNGRATLNTILRYRDMWRKPTIYTANIPMNEAQSKYGASNFSIIRGRSIMISMTNDADFRVQRRLQQEYIMNNGVK